MKLSINKLIPFLLSLLLVIIFFWQFFFRGLLPIPADAIIGLYHPYRDLYAKDYPRGIPFKNFLITDPVRQQYPWKNLSINLIKEGDLPLWNPYSFSGTPLLANFQSATFYPLNVLFFILPFNLAWSLLIILGVFLSLVFMFYFLSNLKLNRWSSLLGSIVFAFSGFSIAWLEWGNILHTIAWLPLMLLSVDKIVNSAGSKTRSNIWLTILTFSLISSFFAGHLQIFSYIFMAFLIYLLFRLIETKPKKLLRPFLLSLGIFLLITSVQWIPTLHFIIESGRTIDQSNWQKIGWFIPWQHLLQFVVPDFFGNPATLNYWGVFNYGEFVGYVGVLPLILGIFALFFRKDKNVFLFGLLFFLSLIFSLPTPFAKIPYILNLPFVSTSQPTRLISIIDFSLAVLSAYGLDLFLKERRKIIYPIIIILLIYISLWAAVIFLINNSQLRDNMLIAKNNLIFPTVIFGVSVILISLGLIKSLKRFTTIIILGFILLAVFDLFRFGWKFTPFTKENYLFPDTKTLAFLKDQKGQFRIMTGDSRIFSPNFSDVYKLESVDGYDPLYLQRYAELIVASERGKPDISPPFGFDRIITPHNFDSRLIDLLGVKYLLSLSDISNKNFEKVFSEGETRVYQNKNALPRAFFVKSTIMGKDKNESIGLLFSNKEKLNLTAIVEGFKNSSWSLGEAQILSYKENKVLVKTKNEGDGFLVLTDSFYPSWHVKIDGKSSQIYRTDYNFRGIVVPGGSHAVEFYITLF